MINTCQDPDDALIPVRHYTLRPLRRVQNDELRSVLGTEPGMYISEYPGSVVPRNGSASERLTIRKKYYVFDNMGPASIWLSMSAGHRESYHLTDGAGRDLHEFGRGALCGRLAQLFQTVALARALTAYRARYKYVIMYNFSLPAFVAALYAKVLLRKHLYVEYEDDYTLIRKNCIKNAIERALRKTVDGAICVNEHMRIYFGSKPVRICNAVADLSYATATDWSLKDNMSLLYGGTLDAIRGADLLPDVLRSLRARLRTFTIYVTGKGPLLDAVRSLQVPEIQYCGVLPEQEYAELVASVDACLVLQKPDHPFSRGSFPSKIEEYARHKKPIYILTM